MPDVQTPVLGSLPFVVTSNAGRKSTAARAFFGGAALFIVAGTLALPLRDLVLGTDTPRPWGVYYAGGLVAFFAWVFWHASRPVSWTIGSGGITQVGPGEHRRDLRWGDVQRVMKGGKEGELYEFHGWVGRTPLRLSGSVIPKSHRASILAGVDAILHELFDFPPPPTGGIVMAWARGLAVLALVLGPFCIYCLVLASQVSRRPQSVLGWARVYRLIAWDRGAAQLLVTLIFLTPPFSYMGIAAWLVHRKHIRDTQTVPKQPGAPRAE
jgi:hypothetical protein